MGRCECCRVEKGAARASFDAGSASDLDLPGEQPSTGSTSHAHPGWRRFLARVRVRVEHWLAVEREREQRRTHRPCEPAAPRATPRCGREGVLLYACTLYYCMAVALPRMRLPSSCPPPNGITYTVSSAASSLASSSSSSSPSPHQQQHHRAGALHYSLLPRGQRHRTRLYHGWSARVATCARPARPLARSLARSAMCGSQCCPLSHTQRSSAKLACLPITNHRRRPWVREACPLLCLTCSWRLLGASLDLAFARVLDIQCFYSASARDHQHCSRMPSAHICSSRAGQGRAWQGIAVIA